MGPASLLAACFSRVLLLPCTISRLAMVWFSCDGCGESLKKPRLAAHLQRCHTRSLTCIDCSCTFDTQSVHAHTSCVTEHQKYALLATKPGGKPSSGGGGAATPAAGADAGELTGLQFLATKPPWLCSCCGISCTSRETLEAHASGKKHRSKARQAAEPAAEQPSAKEHLPAVEPPPPPPAALSRVKWKKAAIRILRANGCSMKLSALRKRVLTDVRKKHAALASWAEDALSAALDERLEASTRFTRDGDCITCAPEDS